MNNKIVLLLFVLVVAAAVMMTPGELMAGGDAAGESSPTLSAENSVEGTLTAMESYGHILIKSEAGKLARLRLRGDSVIIRNEKPAKLADLRLGDKVQAKYDAKNWVSDLRANGR